MITIVDYGMGNLGSVQNMFRRIEAPCQITSDLDEIKKAEKILLPGVGAFDAAMQRIRENGLEEILNEKALVGKVPTLGICLGMQLLTKSSEEGTEPGLGWIDAKAKRFPKSDTLKVPHMGWNIVEEHTPSPLLKDMPEEMRFYFVHSFYVEVENEQNSMLKTDYGLSFDSGIQNDNIFGCQFHPEKSHKFGMKLFSNFAKL